jgi:outer membrane protein assembly factor BamD (BamD/ComL family)
MNRRFVFLFFTSAFLVLMPFRSPAPLIYTPGEGWTYEPVGGEGKWQKTRAKDQLIAAQDAFDKKDYRIAMKAARRVVRVWPLSDYAPQAQYIVGRCYEARGMDERAFKEYQKLVEKYPKAVHYDEVVKRQYQIANRFLAGQWFKLWDYIPFFPSMDRTAGLYEKIVKNGPYSEIAPEAQLKIGEAREKQDNYPDAVKAYEVAADRYNDRPLIAANALYNEGLAYHKQAATAEYDQNTAAQAIATFTDFMTLFPNDSRLPAAQKIITQLRTEQARGNLEIAAYYEKNQKWPAARIYYNEVISLMLGEPNSPYAVTARERLDALNKRLQVDAQP